MDIAIIGMGIAGISVLRELIDKVENINEYAITIYTDKKTFGTGFPYQNDDSSLLLNQYAETMSAVPEDTLNFVRWIKKNKKLKNPTGQYVPRFWYGEYLLELLKKLLSESNVTIIEKEIISIRINSEKKYILTTSENSKVVDFVHLTIGHLAYQDPFNLKGSSDYIQNPYPVEDILSKIPPNAHVGILGTGLSAIDVLLYLKKVNSYMKISMFSPNGEFRSIRGPEKRISLLYITEKRIRLEAEKNNGFLPFNILKDLFELEIKNQGLDLSSIWINFGLGTIDGLKYDRDNLEELGRFQSVIQSIKKLIPTIWDYLSEEGREIFLNEYADVFLKFRSPIPTSSADKIIHFSTQKTLFIYKNIYRAESLENGFKINMDNPSQSITVDYLINATGQETDLNRTLHLQQPLIEQLINERILLPNKHGGVQVLFPEMSVVNQRYGVLSTFKIYGQLVSGIDYENNTVELIIQSVSIGVSSMIRDINRKIL